MATFTSRDGNTRQTRYRPREMQVIASHVFVECSYLTTKRSRRGYALPSLVHPSSAAATSCSVEQQVSASPGAFCRRRTMGFSVVHKIRCLVLPRCAGREASHDTGRPYRWRSRLSLMRYPCSTMSGHNRGTYHYHRRTTAAVA
jgi:hypothetical protein